MDDRNHQTLRHGAGASKFCPADGSSNVLLHGSVAVAGWQRISKRQSPAPLPGRSLRTSEPSRGADTKTKSDFLCFCLLTRETPHLSSVSLTDPGEIARKNN